MLAIAEAHKGLICLGGKIPAEVAKRAKLYELPVIALVGKKIRRVTFARW